MRKNLASALEAAKKQAVAGDEDGPASIAAVTRAQHRVALGTADVLDGAGDELTWRSRGDARCRARRP